MRPQGDSWTRSAERVQSLHSRTKSEDLCIQVITKADFYEWGLSGRSDSTARRAAVLHALDLPAHMTANALLEFINAVGTHEQVAEIIQQYAEKIEE